MSSRRAFTLIELLVVISIIALLSSVVLASLNSAREKGRIGGAKYFASQVDHIAGDSAVGMWDFDECSGSTAVDRSGSGNDGTLSAGASFSATTPSGAGCSLSLNGSTGYASFAQPLSSGSSFTISMWFYPERINPSYDMLYSGTDNIDLQAFFHASTKKLTTSIENVEVASNFTLTGATINKWHHIAWTYDYSRRKVYIDGVLDTDVADSTGLALNDATVRLGETLGNSLPFQGKIDGFRVFSKVLTAADIKQIYAEGIGAHAFARR